MNKIKNINRYRKIWMAEHFTYSKKVSRIKKLIKQDFKKKSNWNTHFAWLTENALKFQEEF